MKTPEYRILTICPDGMSSQLRNFLNRSVEKDAPMLMKDAIAVTLTGNLASTGLPFGGVCLGWINTDHPSDSLRGWLNCLSGISAGESGEPMVLELFTQKVARGTIALGGFYPLAELDTGVLAKEYPQFSLLQNKPERERLLEWSYRGFLHGVLATDPKGVICAVLADSGAIAEEKLCEAGRLLEDQWTTQNSSLMGRGARTTGMK
jgi:hypothetical protein